MAQLTFGDIIKMYQDLVKIMKMSEVNSLPVYIGDDEELNGIHNAWYTQIVEASDKEDSDLIERINENSTNIQFKDKAILIS